MTDTPAENARLLRCPFCGSVYRSIESWNNLFAVRCMDCAATSHTFRESAQAFEAWNRRAPSPDVARLRRMLMEAKRLFSRYLQREDALMHYESDIRALIENIEALAAAPPKEQEAIQMARNAISLARIYLCDDDRATYIDDALADALGALKKAFYGATDKEQETKP